MTSVQEKYQINDDRPIDIDTEKGASTVKGYDSSSDHDGGVIVHQEYEPLTDKEYKRLRWKLDLRIVPFCGLLYLCSFLDRSNIGNNCFFYT